MNGKWLACLLMAAVFQAGCWTVYWSEEARHWPVFPTNPDGVCPEVATGVYADSAPVRGVRAGLIEDYFGTVEQKDESLRGVVAPESWPAYVVSVERLGPREIKIAELGHLKKIGPIYFVKGFKAREIKKEGDDVVETLCDKGVYYDRRAGMVRAGIDRSYREYVTLVSKGANNEIIIKKYDKDKGRPFGIPILGGLRKVDTFRPVRISDKPLDFDSLRGD
jgi:hypothetical protein